MPQPVVAGLQLVGELPLACAHWTTPILVQGPERVVVLLVHEQVAKNSFGGTRKRDASNVLTREKVRDSGI